MRTLIPLEKFSQILAGKPEGFRAEFKRRREKYVMENWNDIHDGMAEDSLTSSNRILDQMEQEAANGKAWEAGMNILQNSVKQALEDKAPSLHRELLAKGELDRYVANLADEINSQTVSLQVSIANKQGLQKETDLTKRVGILNAAGQAAQEIVLSEMLEFPTD